jgi:hypothetical protein
VNNNRVTINESRDLFSFEDLMLKRASLHSLPISAASFQLLFVANLQL